MAVGRFSRDRNYGFPAENEWHGKCIIDGQKGRAVIISHVAKVDLEIADLDVLAEAAIAMGGEYLPNETKWRWYGSWQNDYAAKDAAYLNGIPATRYGTSDAGIIRLNGASWDIGVYKVPGQDGKFTLVYDNYGEGHGIEKACGKNLVGLKTRYGAVAATRQLKKQGFAVREETVNNRLRLVATKSKF
jgi:hypothetical protein